MRPDCLRSRGTHARSILFPLGNAGYGFVSRGNKLAARVSLLCYYSASLFCRFVVEQPQNSQACDHPRVASLFEQLAVRRAAIWLGAYVDDGVDATPKRLWLYSTCAGLLENLQRAAGSLTPEQREKLSSGSSLTKRQRRDDGSYMWSGIKETMNASQNLGGETLSVPNIYIYDGA